MKKQNRFIKTISPYWARLIGATLGYLALDWAGLLLGFFLGWGLDKLRTDKGGGYGVFEKEIKTADTRADDFILSAMILASAVIKADGRVSELEFTYIRRFFVNQFSAQEGEYYLAMLQKMTEQDYDMQDVGLRIRRHTGYETRLQLIYFLFGIADSNYEVSQKEMAVLRNVSRILDLSPKDFESIRAMFRQELDGFYKILEITPAASDAELRQAYLYMAKKYHPDKVAHLGAGVENMAKQKFQKIQQAYESICKSRGAKAEYDAEYEE